MYTNKNKGISFFEVMISSSIIMYINILILTFLFLYSNFFSQIEYGERRKKGIESFRYLLESNIALKHSIEIRILDISYDEKYINFNKIFNESSLDEANTLVIKSNSYDKNEKEIKIIYKFFSFYKDSVIVGYFKEGEIVRKSKMTELIGEFTGKFFLEKNYIRVVVKDLKKYRNKDYIKEDKIYEFIFPNK